MSQDNPKLTEFVISGFTDLKAFQTQVVKRKVNIGTPESSSVKLFDEQGKTIYIPSLLELDYSTPTLLWGKVGILLESMCLSIMDIHVITVYC